MNLDCCFQRCIYIYIYIKKKKEQAQPKSGSIRKQLRNEPPPQKKKKRVPLIKFWFVFIWKEMIVRIILVS